jgi:hypothetical protein
MLALYTSTQSFSKIWKRKLFIPFWRMQLVYYVRQTYIFTHYYYEQENIELILATMFVSSSVPNSVYIECSQKNLANFPSIFAALLNLTWFSCRAHATRDRENLYWEHTYNTVICSSLIPLLYDTPASPRLVCWIYFLFTAVYTRTEKEERGS